MVLKYWANVENIELYENAGIPEDEVILEDKRPLHEVINSIKSRTEYEKAKLPEIENDMIDALNHMSEEDFINFFKICAKVRTEAIWKYIEKDWKDSYELEKEEMLTKFYIKNSDLDFSKTNWKTDSETLYSLADELIQYIRLDGEYTESAVKLFKKAWKSFEFFKYVFNAIDFSNIEVKNHNFSINATEQDLINPKFVQFLTEKEWVIPGIFTIELIEDYWSQENINKIINNLTELQNIWFKIAIDDYNKKWSDDNRIKLLQDNNIKFGLKVDGEPKEEKWSSIVQKLKNAFSEDPENFSENLYVKHCIKFFEKLKREWIQPTFERITENHREFAKAMVKTFWKDILLQWWLMDLTEFWIKLFEIPEHY